ncbi:MAG: tail fiber domain-containing protein [Acidobacteriota bacterium]
MKAGNSAELRLEQDTSDGWPSYTWDIGGNESNFFIRDAGEGSLPFKIRPGAPTNSIYVTGSGNLCLGCSGTGGNAIKHSSGATLTSGGTWTNASSRTLKEDIHSIDAHSAYAALAELEPVTFRYKAQRGEVYAGFIAEDVPELVAMEDRKSLTSMDVVAVLTKVLQEQQKEIEALKASLLALQVE